MSADANVFRWVIRNFFSKTQLDAGSLDTRYFTEAEHISTSAGSGDAGKPIKLDAGGKIDASMIDDADVDHGTTGGLTDDDHTQYALLAGRSGGQSLTGGTAASNNLTLQSTSHATKGKILLGTASVYDQADNRLGIITVSPTRTMEVAGTIKVSGQDAAFTSASWGKGLELGEGMVIQWLKSAASVSRALGFTSDGTLYFFRSTANDNSAAPTYDMTLDTSGNFNVTGNITQNSVPVVTTTGSQTLTNKTLTSPIISTISNTGTLTLPTSTDTLVGRATTDTLTNKTLTSPTLTTPTIASFTNATHNHQAASGGGTLDHGAALTGLSDDDHTQYALLAGRSGGSTLYGGTAANDDMIIHGTSNATRTSSYVLLQPTAGNVVIGGTTSAWKFEVAEGNFRIAFNPGYSGSTNYISSYNDAAPGLNTAPLVVAATSFAFTGDSFGIQVSKTPTSSADSSGAVGDICGDNSYIYRKCATGGWKRAAISTF